MEVFLCEIFITPAMGMYFRNRYMIQLGEMCIHGACLSKEVLVSN